MDKNEYKIRLEEIKQQIEQENYTEAAAIADRIEWRKVRNVNTLCMISEVYEAVDRYEDSKTLLLRAYRRSPMSRTVLYRLVEVTIALRQFDESIGYYTEYVQAAPHDLNRYILKYKIYRGRGSSVNEQIDILKEYLDQEYNEKYAYELAKLYREADRMQECIAACDDLVLWFHSGKYVIKALDLKRKYAALTPKQQEIYDGRFALEDEERELQEIGQEKQMVGTDETTLADSIMEDTEKEIAEAVARAAQSEAGVQSGAETQREAETVEPVPAAEAAETAQNEVETAEPAPIVEAAETSATAVTEALPAQPAEAPKEGIPQASQPAEEAQPEEATRPAEEAQPEEATQPAEEAQPEEATRPAEEAMQETETAPAPARVKTKEELQTGIARDMREIIGNVGRLEYIDETEQAMDDLIEESKKDQEREREKTRLRMPHLRMPDLQRKQAAGKLTIDDILLSMGERGDAVREAAAKASPYPQGTPGVLSAVDEALLNMGIMPEGLSKEDAGQNAEAGSMPRKEHVASAMHEILVDPAQTERAAADNGSEDKTDRKEEPAGGSAAEAASETAPETATEAAPEEDVREAHVKHGTITDEELREALMENAAVDCANGASGAASQASGESFRDKTMEEIIAARTRRIPTEQIASLYGRHAMERGFLGGAPSGEEDPRQNAPVPGTEKKSAREEAQAVAAELEAQAQEMQGMQNLRPSYAERMADPDGREAELAANGQGAADQGAADQGVVNPDETAQRGPDPRSADLAEQAASEPAGTDAVHPAEQPIEDARTEESQPSGLQEGTPDAAAVEKPAAPSRPVYNGPRLKDELRELFDGFLEVRGLEGQIVSAIRQTLTKGNDRTSRTGNILVFGAHGSGKTTLAMALAKAIAQEKGQEYVKMARIYSTDLNRKDIAATVAKIAGGVLIVEEAGDLDDGIADQLTTAMEFRTDGLVVIFEDEQAYVHDLLMRHPRLTMKFTSEIYIPKFTAQELAGFGEVYADNRDFALSDASRQVLIDKVQNMMEEQENGEQLSINAVKEVMDRAMGKASGFGRKLFGGRKRYDEIGRVILKEKDFN